MTSVDATPAGAGEDEWIGRALSRLSPSARLLVAPGHDCAAVALGGSDAVVGTTDVVVDGVHFDLPRCGAVAAARKSLLVNLSDLAAAAAVPLAFWVGVVLPRSFTRALFDDLSEGFRQVALEQDCLLAGGDTNVADAPLTIAVTAIGRPGPMGVVTRSGAQPGDVLSVTGPLGGSLAGRHLEFPPRVHEALALARHRVPHAMMDLSDGLSRDLPRLCRMSGVGALVYADLVPVHPDSARAPPSDRSLLEHALHDGEDFELLIAHAPLSPDVRSALAADGVRLQEIGRVTPAATGLRIARSTGGGSLPLVSKGYDHLASRPLE